MAKNHTRNVAGHQLSQVTKSVYKQEFGNGTFRLFIKFRRKRNEYVWRYTEVGDDSAFPDKWSIKSYPTLTDAVIAVNP
ncbi:MAG: hypothetical protein AAF846_22310 [Chloroflexota bacterium]